MPLISVARGSADRRRGAVMLLNSGMDAIPEATVHLRLAATRARLLAFGAKDRPLKPVREATGSRVTLKNIKPWGLRVVLAEGL